eukprot:466449-Pyramimonas_sp.AAC.1
MRVIVQRQGKSTGTGGRNVQRRVCHGFSSSRRGHISTSSGRWAEERTLTSSRLAGVGPASLPCAF